ncbi:response regulator transcription factor, partial [Dehalococcoidia bacterium]|nr:response regulator transcription factor [Dehalococcoidia bacterium]
MRQSKILIIGNDKMLLDKLRGNLLREKYAVVTAADGPQGLQLARIEKPDLILLDVMLPQLDGLEVCRILRRGMSMPILMLSTRGEESDKVIALELGADDCMTTPLSIRELLARVRAMLRRVNMANEVTPPDPQALPQQIRVAGLTIDLSRRRVFRNESTHNLTPKELQLLVFLARNRGHVFSRDHLLDEVWGDDYAGNPRIVDYHIRSLRRKIEDDPSCPVHLVTVR